MAVTELTSRKADRLRQIENVSLAVNPLTKELRAMSLTERLRWSAYYCLWEKQDELIKQRAELIKSHRASADATKAMVKNMQRILNFESGDTFEEATLVYGE